MDTRDAGKMGGLQAAKNMTKQERTVRARAAGKQRWKNHKKCDTIKK